MEQILSLLKVLTEEQQEVLLSTITPPTNAAEKLVYLLISDKYLDEKAVLKKLKVTPASFQKIQTQAKELLIAFSKKSMKSPLADVQVLQQLILKGELKTAKKIFNALEKEMLEKQNWQMLDFIYHEGFRLAQMNGDLKFLEEVANKRSNNIQLYADYVKLYGEVMIEMVRSEKFEERKQDQEAFMKRVLVLNNKAIKDGHNALIHNTLLILYHQYSRYYNEPDKTWAIIQQMQSNYEKYKQALNPVTAFTIELTVINFLCVYDTYGSPEPLIPKVWKRIDDFGVLAKTNLIYALLGYYLCEQNNVAVQKYMKALEQIEDKTHFAAFKPIVQAILCYVEADFKGFQNNLELFYSDPNHTHLPDSEVQIRILELLVLKQQIRQHDDLKRMADEAHYQSKAGALRVYFERNLNKVRYAEEFDMLSFLITPSAKNRQKISGLHNSRYRNSRLLSRFILGVFK